MTKTALRKETRRKFWSKIENKYPGSEIESEMGGIWYIYVSGYDLPFEYYESGECVDKHPNAGRYGNESLESYSEIEEELNKMYAEAKAEVVA